MNEKNFDYLSNQLKYTGFGEELQAQLKEKMQGQEPQFMLNFQKDFGRDQVAATLHFKKSEEGENYFFNRYNLMLKNQQNPDPIKQIFYVSNNQDNITLKEGYNLLSGRAIHKELSTKEGEKYNAWVQLNFKESDNSGNFKMKQFHENYGYDIAATLAKHPIKELQEETSRKNLIESLERGNRQAVTLMPAGGEERKVFIEAVPQFKSLNFYEMTGQRIKAEDMANGVGHTKAQREEGERLKVEGTSQKIEGNGQKVNGENVKMDTGKSKGRAMKDNGGSEGSAPAKRSQRKRQGIS